MCIRSVILGLALTLLTVPVRAQSSTPTAADSRSASTVSERSVYLLDGPFTRESGDAVTLGTFGGGPVVIVMFYASCRMSCPVLLDDLSRLDAALDPDLRSSVQYVLVTMDPARDTNEVLARLAAQYGLDLSRWALLRADMALTRELAAVLGVRFRAEADGEINHSNILTLLDEAGEIALQVEGLRQPVEPMSRAIEQLLR